MLKGGNSQMDERLVKALKDGRKHCDLTQEEVAKQLGVKKNTISNYENSISEPSIDTFLKLCKIYKIDAIKLLGELYGIRLLYNDFMIQPSEISLVNKYRCLNEQSQSLISYELNRELELNIRRYK